MALARHVVRLDADAVGVLEEHRVVARGEAVLPRAGARTSVAGGPVKANPLTDAELDEIERLARTDAAEAYRGPLLALVDEVRRLRALVLDPRRQEDSESKT